MGEDFNLYPLHVFRLVARLGSVTRAAGHLYISQPAVSAHLRSLEQRLGTQLFERTPRGMLLTSVGQAVLEQTNRLFVLYEELPSVADALQGKVKGEVTVAASSTPGAYCLPVFLKRFQELYTEAQPSIVIGDSAEVLEWLRDYRVPMGIVGEFSADNNLLRVEVGSDELRLVTAVDDPLVRVRRLKPRHLQHRTFFIREHGSSTRAGTESLMGELLRKCGRIVELHNTEAIKQVVMSGLGVAVLSSLAMQLEERSGLLSAVPDKNLRQRRSFYLVRRKDRVLTGVPAALWECLTENKVPNSA